MAGCTGAPARHTDGGSTASQTLADLPLSATQAVYTAADSEGIDDTSHKAIAGYRDFLARYPDSADRPEILRRMADLMVDVGEAAAIDTAIDPIVFSQGAPKGAGLIGTATETTNHRFDEPIAIYQGLLSSDPQNPANDEILYQLARAQQNNGQASQALITLELLTTQYPATENRNDGNRIYADTQFRRAEIFFAERDFVQAEKGYADVVALGDSVQLYQQAQYKLGWSLFKQQRYQSALLPFTQILDRQLIRVIDTQQAADPRADPRVALAGLSRTEQEQVADIFRGLSLSFSYLAGPDSIVEFFDQRGERNYQVLLYADLAALYQRNELLADAARTWLALVARDPDGPMAPTAYIKAIDLYQQAGSSQPLWQARADFARHYRWDQDYWVSHSANPPAELVEALQLELVQLSGYHHRRALASDEVEVYQQAERWYRQYLAQFGEAEEGPEINYQLAELLYQRGDYQGAVNEYERVAYDRGDLDLAAKAGRSALQAYQRLAEIEGNREGETNRSAAEATHANVGLNVEMSERLNRSRIRFVMSFPQHQDAAAVWTQTGYELLQQGEADAVVALSENLKQQRNALQDKDFQGEDLQDKGLQDNDFQDKALPPKLQQADRVLWAQAQYERGEFGLAEQGYRQALTNAKIDRSQYLVLQQGIALSLYRQAQTALQRGDQRLAATLFLKVAAVPHLTSTNKEETSAKQGEVSSNQEEFDSMMPIDAQLQAATLLLGLEEWSDAVRVLERLQLAHPPPSLDPQRQLSVTKKLAFAYHRSARYAEAATEYQRLGLAKQGGGEQGQPDLRPQALLRSAELFLNAGQVAGAITVLEAYVERFPKPVGEATQAMLQLANLSYDRGDLTAQRRWLNRIVKADRVDGDATSTVVAANATLQLADPPRLNFEQIELVEPLQQSLTKKLSAMEQALAALASASTYRVASVSNAVRYREAAIYHQFYRSLLDSERPAGLNREETDHYNRLLASQAEPFKQKSILLYQAQMRRTPAEPLDNWTQLSLAALTSLNPQQYAKPERSDPWWRSEQVEPSLCVEVSRWHGCAAGGRPELRAQSLPKPLPKPFREMSEQIAQQQFAEAEALLAKSAQQGHYPDQLLEYIGDAAQRGDFDGVNELLQWLPELDAGKSIAYTQLGIQLRQAGYLSRARMAYQRALEVKPDYPLAHLNLGILCELYLQVTECAMNHYGAFQRLSVVADPQVNRWLEGLQR
ncbi:MAG: tetratricopeptide repeat protein [Motiliproteus sp.]